MNTQPEHYSLNELIQLQDSGWDVNEKFGIDWTPVGTGAIHTFILINAAFSSATCADFLILSYFVFSTPQGELDYQLQDQDNVVFISTLHGG